MARLGNSHKRPQSTAQAGPSFLGPFSPALLPLALSPRASPPTASACITTRPLPRTHPSLRDGGIDAVIDHEGGFMESAKPADVYATDEPRAAYHTRIAFCMDIHNEVRCRVGLLNMASLLHCMPYVTVSG